MRVLSHTGQGYSVDVVTKEYINSTYSGVDFPQKLRNYLRENIANLDYVLLIDFYLDFLGKYLVLFNHDPNISPILSDMYYADLSEPDRLSWNLDGDLYIGEVYDQYGYPNGDDAPDYHPDIHLARFPYSTGYVIKEEAKGVAF